MAEAAVNLDNYRYATGTYGGAVPQEYIPPLVQPEEQPVVRPRVRPRELPRRRFLSMPSVLGFFTIVFLAGVYLVLSARLTAAMTELYATKPLYQSASASDGDNPSVVGLAAMRDNLLEREKELRILYERTFDLGDVEKYAAEKLGMVKAPAAENLTGARAADKAVIPFGTDNNGLLGQILEYFNLS